MNRKILVLLIGLLILSNCKEKNEMEYSFENIQISTSDLYLTLPTGIVKNEIDDYTEGIYQNFTYSDESLVIISTSGFGTIELPENQNFEFHNRKEHIDGILIAYTYVNSERKAEFDRAFDLMKENGIKKR